MRNNLIGLQLKELCFEITNDCLLQCCFCSTFNDKDKNAYSSLKSPVIPGESIH